MLKFVLVLVSSLVCFQAAASSPSQQLLKMYQQAKHLADQGQWNKAAAAYQQSAELPNAQIDISLYQLRGLGDVQHAPKSAQHTLTLVAESGSARAALILANLFQHGLYGVASNAQQAEKYHALYDQLIAHQPQPVRN